MNESKLLLTFSHLLLQVLEGNRHIMLLDDEDSGNSFVSCGKIKNREGKQFMQQRLAGKFFFFFRIYNETFKPVWHKPWVNTTIPCSKRRMNTSSEPSRVNASGKWSREWAAEGWERNTRLLPPVALRLAQQEDDNREECPWHCHLFPQEESVPLEGEIAVSPRSGIRWQQNFHQRECQGRLRAQDTSKLVNGFLRTSFSLYEEAWFTRGSHFPSVPGSWIWYGLCVFSVKHSVLCKHPLGHWGLVVLSPQCLLDSSCLFHSQVNHHSLFTSGLPQQ